MSELTQISKNPVLCAKKCGRPHLKNPFPPCPKNVRTRQTSLPLTADIFYGQPLTNLKSILNVQGLSLIISIVKTNFKARFWGVCTNVIWISFDPGST